jgi:hypothetical protein
VTIREVLAALLAVLTAACATTTHYARRPEAERSANLAADTLRTGMTFQDVVLLMLNVRRPNQYAALESGGTCGGTRVDIIIHAGELVATVRNTHVYAGGFASIQTLQGTALKSEGFERQGALLEAVRVRQADLLVCPQATLSFDAVTEGGCGTDAIPLAFGDDGRLNSIGAIQSSECVHSGIVTPSNNKMQQTRHG